jgi:hypothetical protein
MASAQHFEPDRAAPNRSLNTTNVLLRHTHIGYLFHCLRTGARPGSVQALGPSLSHRLPTLVVWLSFGLRGPGVAQGGERLKRGLLCSK